MRKFGIFILLGLWSVYALGQIVTVRDRESGEFLEHVSLISQNKSVVLATNAKGQVNVFALQNENLVEISFLGYETLFLSYTDLVKHRDSIFLMRDVMNIEEIVISGSRFRQKSSSMPFKIMQIKKEDVRMQNPQTAADLLGISGRVFIQKSQQGGGSPMIRGFAANRLLYSIDGIRLNNAIFRSGNLQQVISLDPFTIEYTEVLMGNGSVVYGSDAIGGVMSFTTLEPQMAVNGHMFVGGNATARYSSANQEKTLHTDVKLGWEKWALLSSFSHWEFDHLRQGKHGPADYVKPYYVKTMDSVDMIAQQSDPLLQIPSGYRQQNLMQKLRFAPNNHLDLQYAFHYSETSEYGRYDRHNRLRNGLPRYAVWNYGPQIWMLNMFTLKHSKASVLYNELSLRIAYQQFEESRIDRNLNDVWLNTQSESVDAYSAHLDCKKDFKSLHLFYGAEYVYNQVFSKGKSADIFSGETLKIASRYPESVWQSAAAYAAFDWQWNNRWLLQSGIRYNYFLLNADFSSNVEFYPFPFAQANLQNDATTGNIGLVYKPAPKWNLAANVSTAFRAPNVDDVGKIFDSEPGSVLIPNPDLEAEYALQFSLSLTKLIGEHLKVDINAYRTYLQNAIVRRESALNGDDSILYLGEMSKVLSLHNAAQADVWGLDGGWDLQLPGGFEFSGDLSVQKGTEMMDDGSKSALRHASPIFGILRAGFMRQKLHWVVYAQFQGEKSHADLALEEQSKTEIYALDPNGNTYAPAWYTLNTKITYRLSDAFSVNAGMENITDVRYRPYSSGISGAGRQMQFSLKIDF